VATGSILTVNCHKAHLDGGSSTANDKSFLLGLQVAQGEEWVSSSVKTWCTDGKSPVMSEGCVAAGIPANNAEGHVPTKCCCTPDIPNFTLSPNSFKPLLGKHHNRHASECNDDKKTFHFSVNHKKPNCSSFCVVKSVSKNKNSWQHEQKTKSESLQAARTTNPIWCCTMPAVNPGINSKCSTKWQSKQCRLFFWHTTAQISLFVACVCFVGCNLFDHSFSCNPETKDSLSPNNAMLMQTLATNAHMNQTNLFHCFLQPKPRDIFTDIGHWWLSFSFAKQAIFWFLVFLSCPASNASFNWSQPWWLGLKHNCDWRLSGTHVLVAIWSLGFFNNG